MNESLIEIALIEMQKKRKPRTLAKISKDVFEIKGLTSKEAAEVYGQFQMDFMLSGLFICCGEDKNRVKLWDLKSRQPSSLLDKDGSYLEDLYAEDEEVIKNELKDDIIFKSGEFDDEEDDSDESDEKDDIEEALLSEEDDEDLEEEIVGIEDEDEEDDVYDDDEE